MFSFWRERRQWPPLPSVEDEAVSLSRELHNHNCSFMTEKEKLGSENDSASAGTIDKEEPLPYSPTDTEATSFVDISLSYCASSSSANATTASTPILDPGREKDSLNLDHSVDRGSTGYETTYPNPLSTEAVRGFHQDLSAHRKSLGGAEKTSKSNSQEEIPSEGSCSSFKVEKQQVAGRQDASAIRGRSLQLCNSVPATVVPRGQSAWGHRNSKGNTYTSSSDPRIGRSYSVKQGKGTCDP